MAFYKTDENGQLIKLAGTGVTINQNSGNTNTEPIDISTKVDKVTTTILSDNSKVSTFYSVDSTTGATKITNVVGETDIPDDITDSTTVTGSAIRMDTESANISYININNGNIYNSGISSTADGVQSMVMKQSSDGSISQNAIMLREDQLILQLYRPSANGTNAANIVLNDSSIQIGHQITDSENNTTASTISLSGGKALYNDNEIATNNNVVHLTGDETVNGIKTFKSTGTVDFGNSHYPIILSGNRQGIKFEDSSNIHIGGEHFSPNAGGIGIGNNLKFYGSTSNYYNIMLGWNLETNKQSADSGDSSIVIGYNSSSSHSQTITMGFNAITNAEKAIQLGKGTNSSSNTFQVFNYQLLDANGKIPNERLNLTESTMTVGETEVTMEEVATLATTAVQPEDVATTTDIDNLFI